jgi:hypothetical protein
MCTAKERQMNPSHRRPELFRLTGDQYEGARGRRGSRSWTFGHGLPRRPRGGCIVNIGTVLVDHAMSSVPASASLTTKGAIRALTVVGLEIRMAAGEIPMGGDALARSVHRIPRVAIVGVGLVGATTAHALLMSGEVRDAHRGGRELPRDQTLGTPSSHVSLISHPREIADLILAAAGRKA